MAFTAKDIKIGDKVLARLQHLPECEKYCIKRHFCWLEVIGTDLLGKEIYVSHKEYIGTVACPIKCVIDVVKSVEIKV